MPQILTYSDKSLMNLIVANLNTLEDVELLDLVSGGRLVPTKIVMRYLVVFNMKMNPFRMVLLCGLLKVELYKLLVKRPSIVLSCWSNSIRCMAEKKYCHIRSAYWHFWA